MFGVSRLPLKERAEKTLKEHSKLLASLNLAGVFVAVFSNFKNGKSKQNIAFNREGESSTTQNDEEAKAAPPQRKDDGKQHHWANHDSPHVEKEEGGERQYH